MGRPSLMSLISSQQQQQRSRSLTHTVTAAADNGSGLVRLTTAANTRRFETGQTVVVANVGGVPAANGTWKVTAVGPNTYDLQGSTFSGIYTSGGTVKRIGG